MQSIELIIPVRTADVEGLSVRRVLPFFKRRMVGPFIFLDHFGPAKFGIGEGIDVRPHPHIGLATVTYLFEGEMIHRDTLGSQQIIRPGDVNWMTAGKGIAHSEHTSTNERGRLHHVHGLQSWVALPKEAEECEPEFFHYAESTLPEIYQPGVKLRVIAGTAYGNSAPTKIYSPLFYIEVHIEASASLTLPQEYSERAVYIVSGDCAINDEPVAEANMAVLAAGKMILTAKTAAHVILLGGEPFPEPRYIYWNFVSSSKERLEKAKIDWKEGRFEKIPGDDKEFVPLPE
jgi:redox-sensitive bicupin YhaK (pirin superfamily)